MEAVFFLVWREKMKELKKMKRHHLEAPSLLFLLPNSPSILTTLSLNSATSVAPSSSSLTSLQIQVWTSTVEGQAEKSLRKRKRKRERSSQRGWWWWKTCRLQLKRWFYLFYSNFLVQVWFIYASRLERREQGELKWFSLLRRLLHAIKLEMGSTFAV